MRPGLAVLLLLLAGCAGPSDRPPPWRRPDPSAAEPQPRWRVPDDGFHDQLAGAADPGYSAAAAKNLFRSPFWFS